MAIQRFTTKWGGRELTVETGRFAQQANGSCTVQYGGTVVLATAVMGDIRPGIDYFPLMVEYEERLYAAGKIKGSRFIKREGRPTDEAVLAARLIDRSIRPLFDEQIQNDVQVVITVLSLDEENDPDVPGLIAASIAITTSSIPWHGPIAGVRIGMQDGSFVLNPTYKEIEAGSLDLFVAGTPDKILMIEAGAKEIPEHTIREAISWGQKELAPILELFKKINSEVSIPEKISPEKKIIEKGQEPAKLFEEAYSTAEKFIQDSIERYFFDSPKKTKADRKAAFKALETALTTHLHEQIVAEEVVYNTVLSKIKPMVEKELSRRILEEGRRVDGRNLTEIRPLTCEVGVLPRTHGSGHFMRGETQVLTVATLGAPGDVQFLDSMEFEGKKRYMHHYNFPPFSVGEVKPMRGPSRRDIGHGALAEKALIPVLPAQEQFPYTIRLVSEVLGSNGSSSMGSTCGSTLALMDAGVPITAPVAGIAMGLATNNDLSKWKVITDLQDLEDGQGGMDFKIAGTQRGITAIQLDTKTKGLTPEIIEQALSQGREALNAVLSTLQKTIPAPRAELSPFAPRIQTIQINPDKIRDVIGPGGKIINKIIDETGVSIDIEQDGRVMITSDDAVMMQKAIDWVKQLTAEAEVGAVYEGKVVRIEPFGAFINILPEKDGMVHVSEISWDRTEHPADKLKMGDIVKVKVKEIDSLGRVNLTMKELTQRPERPFENGNGNRTNGSHMPQKKRGFFHRG